MNSKFLIPSESKAAVLQMLEHGLRGDWDHLPRPGLHASNFLANPVARQKCRERFKKEILKGRMIGGPG